MRRLHTRRVIKSEINIIPFLDILLVLLMIFMIIPSTSMQNFDIHFRDGRITTDIMSNETKIITIEILGTGFYNVITNSSRKEKILLDQIIPNIRYEMHIHPHMLCFIAAPKTTEYHEIIKVLNLLNNIGVRSIGMITKSSI